MRRLLACLLATAALSGMSAAAWAEDVLSEVSTIENEYFNNWDQGAKQAAEALGLNYQLLADKGDAAKQIEIYEAQFARGVKITFGENLNASNLRQIVEKAKKAGAVHVGVWESLPGFHPLDAGEDNYAFATFFTPDDVQSGYRMAKLLFDKIGGKGNVVHITGFPGAPPDVARTAGFDRALAEYPGIKLIARQPGKWNQNDSRKVMEDLLVAHPDINAVFGQNDSIALGAMQAVEDAGLTLPIVGLDGNKETLDLIKEGRILGTMAFTPQWQAGYALVRAYDVSKGFKPSPCERMMYTGATQITAANVDTYQKFLSGDKLPFDWKKMSRTLHPNDWDPQNVVWPIDVASYWGKSTPAGYTFSKAYQEAFDSGCVAKLKAEYETHYKQRIPD
ncbi:sugar ABC transporter substrate-binding protein [Rhizobium sp. BK068]|uniref:sugar ABC transporter substrate-binding protein n=1 Tax=Rhizobium sp. BK068 TaxID=2512130 RepID=UPI001052BA7D|nr:sugar ABC transporter substrate-binding protein [Rhizobium sp. BK068]TCM76667.1 monosaccharide ABC transporter substrate-binding protein (CUT2 family) [Rhizobium sp. BK068]